MFIVIVLIALVLWGITASIIEVRRDGYRRRPTAWTRLGGDALDVAEYAPTYR